MAAFLFPGQGSQYVGMGRSFFDAFSIARETFEEADDLLTFSLSKIIFEGPEQVLTETKHSQLAIFVMSAALLRVLRQQLPDLVPTVCAGLSLGEYTALYASNRLRFADALQLVRLRGELMNRSCEEHPGSMAAVLGLTSLDVEEVMAPLADSHLVWVANYNSPGQTVISGTKEGLSFAAEKLKARGAKRVIPLQVHGAFHSGLMKSSSVGLRDAVMNAPFLDSDIALVMNVPGDFVQDLPQIKENLISQVTSSVRWEQGIQVIMKGGEPSLYLEIGCGKTLCGMNRKIGVSSPSLPLEEPKDLDVVVRTVEQLVGR